jgi:hypothetical protein
MAKHSPRFLKLVEEAKARIKELTISDVKAKLDRGERFTLVDVREDHEMGRWPPADGRAHAGHCDGPGVCLERQRPKSADEHAPSPHQLPEVRLVEDGKGPSERLPAFAALVDQALSERPEAIGRQP